MDLNDVNTNVKILGLVIAVVMPLALSWLTVWYNMRRTVEILREHTAKDKLYDLRIHDLELQQVKLTAEVDGLAGKIFTKLDSLKEAVSVLSSRMNSQRP